MPQIESSIIMPVFNKWDLTRNCLKSLAATTDLDKIEVIVVDNASTDVTPKACAFLGKELFRDNFKYIRNEQNRNFAGASNQGAEAARGNFLVFLNNDTVAEPGWYEPLIEDFSTYPDLAATGPLLVYPDETPFGRLVQHLGILVNPYFKFGHLYQGIPESSTLAKKRRFFQAITAACLVIKKNLFLEIGKFDEGYKNGFEDVDLCGRLTARGMRFTVNPLSKVIHYEGQSPGRGKDDKENLNHLREKSTQYFKPDWHLLLNADNLHLEVDEWVHLQTGETLQFLKKFDPQLPSLSREELKKTIIDHPYWQNGWEGYLSGITDKKEYLESFGVYFKLFKTIPKAAKALEIGKMNNDKSLTFMGEMFLKNNFLSSEALLENAESGKKWCSQFNLPDIAQKYEKWIKNYAYFKENMYKSYMSAYFKEIGDFNKK